MKIENLYDLFVIKLKALYDIETQITKALPKMAKKATDIKLKTAFEDHLAETKVQVTRLEKIFKSLDMKPGKIKVEAIRGLVADTESMIKEKLPKFSLDAVLICSAESVEHYEMAGYESLRDWALILGMSEAADLLEETLKEEKTAATLLGMIANDGVNEKALPKP